MLADEASYVSFIYKEAIKKHSGKPGKTKRQRNKVKNGKQVIHGNGLTDMEARYSKQ